jgi:hypothetical protein
VIERCRLFATMTMLATVDRPAFVECFSGETTVRSGRAPCSPVGTEGPVEFRAFENAQQLLGELSPGEGPGRPLV